MPPRSAYDSAAIETLLSQAGRVARTAELETLGVGRSTIHYRCRPAGPWQRVLPGILIAHNGAPTLHQHLTAALIYAKPGAMLTGACALRLRGLRSAPGTSIDVLVPHERSRTSSGRVSVKRTTRLPAAQMINGLACAPIARSVVDACRATADLPAVRAMTAEVVQRGLCSVAALADELRACSTRGSALPRRVMQEISAGVRSVAEARARALILGARPSQAGVECPAAYTHRSHHRLTRRLLGRAGSGTRDRLAGMASVPRAISADAGAATSDGSVWDRRCTRNTRSHRRPAGRVPRGAFQHSGPGCRAPQPRRSGDQPRRRFLSLDLALKPAAHLPRDQATSYVSSRMGEGGLHP